MELLDKREVAALLKLSTVSIDRYRQAGLLPFRKFGSLIRFTENDINEFIERASVDNGKLGSKNETSS